MSFSGFKANTFTGGAISIAVPLAGALVGGAVEGARAAGDRIAADRADIALRCLLTIEQRYIDTLAAAADAESAALAGAARLRMTMAESVMRARSRA